MKTKFEEMTCCSWHTPKNAIVNIKTGAIVPKEALDRIPDGKAKDMMMFSGNMCDPCAKMVLEGRWKPQEETIMQTQATG